MSYSDFLKDHHISERLGFVLEHPVSSLDDSKFREWMNACNQVTNGSDVTSLRKTVESIGDFDVQSLTTHEELRYAKLLLETIVQGYLYLDVNVYEGEDLSKVPDRLPSSIARPLLEVSELLGMKPVISQGSLVLANVKLIEGKEDAEFIAENMELIIPRMFLENADKEAYGWFLKVTAESEACFARAMRAIGAVCYAFNNGESPNLEEALSAIIDNCERAKLAIKKYRDRLSPRIFFYEVRPCLRGYDQIPDGLKFGSSEEGLKYRGASAASTSIQVIDAFLDLKLNPAQRGFVLHLREFMPSGHRKFVEYIEATVAEESCELAQLIHDHPLFPSAMKALREFRSGHINLVTLYVVTTMPKMEMPVSPGKMLIGFMKSFRDACVLPDKQE